MLKIAAALEQGPATRTLLETRTGISQGRLKRVLKILEKNGSVRHTETIVKGNECWTYESVNLELQNVSHQTPF